MEQQQQLSGMFTANDLKSSLWPRSAGNYSRMAKNAISETLNFKISRGHAPGPL